MKGYDKFPFEERKRYEETFVQNNSSLIEELTGVQVGYLIYLKHRWTREQELMQSYNLTEDYQE